MAISLDKIVVDDYFNDNSSFLGSTYIHSTRSNTLLGSNRLINRYKF